MRKSGKNPISSQSSTNKGSVLIKLNVVEDYCGNRTNSVIVEPSAEVRNENNDGINHNSNDNRKRVSLGSNPNEKRIRYQQVRLSLFLHLKYQRY